MKYKDIANKHGVTEDAVKQWARRHWKKVTKSDNVKVTQGDSKKAAVLLTPPNDDEFEKKAKKAVGRNPSLDDKKKLFCLYYIKSFNATRSYQKAYGCSYVTASGHGWEMLSNDEVREEIARLKAMRNISLAAEADDLVEYHMSVAFSDITDFVEFGRETIPVMGPYGQLEGKDEKTGKRIKLTKEVNVVKFKESSEVDGRLLSEVRQGKDGASIKMESRQYSLSFLERWFMANPMDRHKTDYDNHRLELERKRTEAAIRQSEETGMAMEQNAGLLGDFMRVIAEALNPPVEEEGDDDGQQS